LIAVPAAFAQNDMAGSKDFPGLTRMASIYIYAYKDLQFDSETFTVTANGNSTEQAIEGHTVRIHYCLKDKAPESSMLQVARNCQNAARAAGGEVLDDHKGGNYYNTSLRISMGGRETWIIVKARTDCHELTVVERQAMHQDVLLDAAGIASGLNSNGSVAVYGIYFDTAKSDLKPESEPALGEISKLMKGNQVLKVFVSGHTDMVGDPAANLKLSQARAQSVINALVTKYGIAAARLTAFGNGPYAPVASNKTEEGRAKNRRVELVEAATQ
jgi:OmpA-OmpF porin, OOP family